MKLIIAIVKPDRLEAVKQELYKVDVNLMTVTRSWTWAPDGRHRSLPWREGDGKPAQEGSALIGSTTTLWSRRFRHITRRQDG